MRDINILTNYRDQLYAAMCLSVFNSVEKILRWGLIRRESIPLLIQIPAFGPGGDE